MTRAVLALVRWLASLPGLGPRLANLGAYAALAHRGSLGDPRLNGEHELIRRVVRSVGAEGSLTLFDVGANIGDWTSFAIRTAVADVKVHAFEPSTTTFETLQRRFVADARVTTVRAALSDATSTATLRVYPDHETLNTLTESRFHDFDVVSEEVETITGDEYCHREGIPHIDLLKIDTEGLEWKVIQGFAGMLRERRIRVLQFEYGYLHGVEGHLIMDFASLLEGWGYRVGPVRPTGVEFRSIVPFDNNFESGPNYAAALPEIAGLIEADGMRSRRR